MSLGAYNLDEGRPVDVIKEIMDKLNVNTFTVMGFSCGGGVAISLSLKYSTRIEKIVLYMASYTDDTQADMLMRQIKQNSLILWFREDQIHSYKLGRYFHKVLENSEHVESSCGVFEICKAKFNYEAYRHLTIPIIVDFLKRN